MFPGVDKRSVMIVADLGGGDRRWHWKDDNEKVPTVVSVGSNVIRAKNGWKHLVEAFNGSNYDDPWLG